MATLQSIKLKEDAYRSEVLRRLDMIEKLLRELLARKPQPPEKIYLARKSPQPEKKV